MANFVFFGMNKIPGLQTQIKEVIASTDWSETGRAKRIAELQAQIASYREGALVDVKQEWDKIRTSYSQLEGARREAEATEAAKWDYQRLGYAAQTVRGAITLAARDSDGLRIVKDEYKRAVAGGDDHLARAWAETAPALLPEKFPGQSGVGSLTGQMGKDLVRLRATTELTKLDKLGTELTKQAMELAQGVDEARKVFDPNEYSSPFAVPGDIHLTQKFDTDSGGIITTLEIDGA